MDSNTKFETPLTEAELKTRYAAVLDGMVEKGYDFLSFGSRGLAALHEIPTDPRTREPQGWDFFCASSAEELERRTRNKEIPVEWQNAPTKWEAGQ